MTVRKKRETEKDVYTAACERVESLHKRFDRVPVSFSGGKDSTAALHVTLEVARSMGRLPVEVYFFDEECIHPETIDYVDRVRQRDDVEMYWYCLPMKRGNACSRVERKWYPWDSTKRELWVRGMPECAITELRNFDHRMTTAEIVPLLYDGVNARVAHIRGLRADESINRYRAVAQRSHDNWLNGPYRTYWSPSRKTYEIAEGAGSKAARKNTVGGGNCWFASPIYDWSTLDVWVAPWQFGWDYNKAYDVMSAAGIAPHDQRVCVPFGEEPIRGLYQYAECWPELWGKMVNRVKGANTAARYANTELYGAGRDLQPPPGMTWRKWLWSQIDMYSAEDQKRLANTVKNAISQHRKKTGRSVPDEEPDLVTGISWKFLCYAVIRGDMLGRTMANMSTHATAERNRRGISYEQAALDR